MPIRPWTPSPRTWRNGSSFWNSSKARHDAAREGETASGGRRAAWRRRLDPGDAQGRRQAERGRSRAACSARRLSNAEYDYTIRDLTGVDIRPTREFPVDPANEAGFDNSAESLTMSPALVKKYLEAARVVADHLVLKPRGFAFAPLPVVADTDRDKYCVRRIIDFYKRQPTDYADYFFAAWRFQHRTALGSPDVSLADVATEAGVSAKYLDTIWSIAHGTGRRGRADGRRCGRCGARCQPLAAARAEARRRHGCERLRDFVIELRQQLDAGRREPARAWHGRRLAAAGALEKPPVRGKPQAVRRAERSQSFAPTALKKGTPEARALALPASAADAARYEPAFARFCAVFPDAFVVSERARVYLDPKQEKA